MEKDSTAATIRRTSGVRLLAVKAPVIARTLLATTLAAVTAAAALGGAPPTSAKPGTGPLTGTGTVFKVNPVQSSGNQALTDQKDSDAAVPMSGVRGRAAAEPRRLGLPAREVGQRRSPPPATPAYSRPTRSTTPATHDQFEQVMGYFWVNQAQEYLQSLGFGGDAAAGRRTSRSRVKINQYGGDNSYQTDKPYQIRLGKGGVDDAEDAEVIVHEYGHAMHDAQVPGFGGQPRRRVDR